MEPSQNHAESWRQIRAFLDEPPGDADGRQWQGMARSIVVELEKLGLPGWFRVDGSARQVILSTAESLGPDSGPRVTLEFQPAQQTVRIAYGHSDLAARAPLLDAWVSAPTAVQVTLGALRRLWTETRPTVPMPEELQERKPPGSA